MELSEHESRILQELEEDLAAGDQRLARVMGTTANQANAVRRLVLGTAAMGLGIGLMIFALALRSIPVGSMAFAVMTAGGYVASPSPTPFGAWREHRRSAAELPKAREQ